MNKEELLEEFAKHTWAGLRPSALHGIGVFALCDIPQGVRSLFSANTGEWIKLSFAEVEDLPEHSRSIIETHCLYDEEHYYVPGEGFKKPDMSFYLNHSSTPNIISVNDGDYFETIRDIAAGEELLVNYTSIVDVEGYE